MSDSQMTGGVPRRTAAPGRAWKMLTFAATVRGTILIACLTISLLTGALGLFAISAIRSAGGLVADTFDQSLISISYARAGGSDFATMDASMLRMRLADDPTRIEMLRQKIETAAQDLADDLKIAVARSRSPRAAAAAVRVQDAIAGWRDLLHSLPAGRLSPADAARIDKTIGQANEQIEELIELTTGEAFRQRELAMGMVGRFTRLTLLGTLWALSLSACITWLLARRIIGPVTAALSAAGRIAGGDMHVVIPPGGSDELGRLLRSMAGMRDSIRAMMEGEVAQRRSAQSQLVDAVESSSEGVILVAADGRIGLVNTQALRLLAPLAELLQPDRPLAELVGAARSCGIFLPPGVGQTASHPTEPGDWLLPAWTGASEVSLADGHWLQINRSATSDGGSIAILTDITALKSYQDALEKTNLGFAAALNNMSQGLCLFDADGRLQVLNNRFREIYRMPVGTPQMGISLRALIELRLASSPQVGLSAADVYRAHAAIIARCERAEVFEETADARTIAISHVPMETGGFVATFEDITAQRRSLAQIQFMAHHDSLTGLGNRVKFIEQLTLALSQATLDQHVAVLHLNLDHFKTTNDTLGHPLGDELLHAVGQRLLACRGDHEAVFRLGADEFAIIHGGIAQPEEAAVLARRIIAAIRAGVSAAGRDLPMGVSIGIAVAPADGNVADRLAEHADMAMDRAKTDERGTYRFFEPDMNIRLQNRRMLEHDLRHALAEGELELFFQPLVNLQNQRISGFEALLRWRHPTRGIIAPTEFIPLAEELGLIVQIGEWALHRACAQAATWPAPIRVAVNVSPIQFKSATLVRAVADALAVSGLTPDRLELEITESVLLVSTDSTLATLQSLKRLGTRIGMDDFGTGYSSLSYLRSFPFDKIKIDQSFIREYHPDNNSGAIVNAIAAMAHSLGMRTVAEGVETQEQLDMVRAAGCSEAQGYLFSRPRPGAEIAALIAAELVPSLH